MLPCRCVTANKKPAEAGFLREENQSLHQRSLISLYSTCFRAFGSNFMNSSFWGVVFLFLLVV
jgi:hypothetical protein